LVAFVAALAGETITASPQARLKSSEPFGASSPISTVASSIAVTSLIPAKSCFWALVESGARARSRVKTTSSAVKGVPSWKATPPCRWKTQESPSGAISQLSASAGRIVPSGAKRVRPSKTLA
jgi:hypothetical protein